MNQAVILAGGKASRLQERLGGSPKCLVDICGVPLLERQVLLLKSHGFGDILILVHHAAAAVTRFCSSRGNWGLNVRCIDDVEPRGTAGAVLAVLSDLAEEFLVVYGDIMLDVDLKRFREYSQRHLEAGVTLFVHPNDHPADSDLVEMDDDGNIARFHLSPHEETAFYPNLVSAALYWVRKWALAAPSGPTGAVDFAKELFPSMLCRGVKLRGYWSFEYVKDIGTPHRLDQACADFHGGKVHRAGRTAPQRIIFLDRDGTINREVHHLRRVESFELLPGVAPAIRSINVSEYRCCVVTNQPVVARGDLSFDGLRRIHNKMETQLGAYHAFVDRIYVCPHHPDGGFAGERPALKIRCACRKPGIGLIERAIVDFNGDRQASWLIGDRLTDIQAANRAGLHSILIGPPERAAQAAHARQAVADASALDLPAAIARILRQFS